MDIEIQIGPVVFMIGRVLSSYYFSLGYNMTSWRNIKQLCVVLGMTEAEYVEACETSREAMWIWKLLNIGLNFTCR